MKARDYLLKNFRNDESLILERGTSNEIFTKYDNESDKMIIAKLKEKFPEHNIVT